MGFGGCLLQKTVQPNTSNGTRRRKPRVHCDSFYWDISSVIIKTACLATFFVVESPRRIVSYVTRKPEPKPFFTCSRWGYRMCACGHHYYDHQDVSESEKFFSRQPRQDQSDLLLTKNSYGTDRAKTVEDNTGSKTSSASEELQQKPRRSKRSKRKDEIVIKGASVKDLVHQIAEKSGAAQDATSNTKPYNESSQSVKPVRRKRRRRWYWPF